MCCKAAFLFLTLLVGSYAFPLEDEQDLSIFFDHAEIDSRIVGGVKAADPVPHMVALTHGGLQSLLCGGSLISNRHVLTAAHCIAPIVVNGVLSERLVAVVGSNRGNSGGTQYRFSRHHIHPQYDRPQIKNDIGILGTSNTVAMSNVIRVVPLSYEFVGGDVAVRVNGWGMIRQGGPISADLLELRAKTVEGNRCVQEVRRRAAELNIPVPGVQPRVEICIFAAANKGTCHGDSGSALVRQDNGQQIGVVSWGLPCARNAPDMYARVSAYQSWIEQIIG